MKFLQITKVLCIVITVSASVEIRDSTSNWFFCELVYINKRTKYVMNMDRCHSIWWSLQPKHFFSMHTKTFQNASLSSCCPKSFYISHRVVIGKSWKFMKQNNLHWVLGSCGFQWCVFHLCAFSKNSPNIQLMRFLLHKWKNSFTHAFLVTNVLSAVDLVHADFCQT